MEQRWASFAAPNSAAKQAKLPQQSAPDNANFLEFACNVSSVFSPPTFNTSNVRGNAELSEIPWLLYDFVQFLFGVLLPFVYGILKRCGARVLFEMLINTHIDIAVPLVSILFSAMGAIIFVGEDNVRKRRRRETPLVNVLMIGIDVGLTMAWWVSLPFLFLAFPFVIVWRLLVVMWRIICIVDRIAYALGMHYHLLLSRGRANPVLPLHEPLVARKLAHAAAAATQRGSLSPPHHHTRAGRERARAARSHRI